MEGLFGGMFFPAFTCPRGGHNHSTIMCIQRMGFKVFSSYHNIRFRNRLLYSLGRTLRRTHLLGKRISYHTMRIPGTNVLDISMSMSFIRRYLSSTECHFYTLDFLNQRFRVIRDSGLAVLGVTVHHRYHERREDMNLIRDFLSYLRGEGVVFTTIEAIYQAAITE